MRWDVAVAGGGPAGLAVALEAARRGLSVAVFERRTGSLDKACGEGLLPAGVEALARLGALGRLDPARHTRLGGIRFVQEDGSSVTGRFRAGFGLGVRRTALWEALHAAACAAGVQVEQGRAVFHVEPSADRVRLVTSAGEETARLLVVADGLHSPLRRRLGLDGTRAGTRTGLRAHVAGIDPGTHVEVHWADGVEAYLTPCGPGRLGVAFLFDRRRPQQVSFEALLTHFPAVAARLEGGQADSAPRGAGPFGVRARSVVQGRVVLAGDAAGYVDAITGEGLTLAFASARALGALLPEAVSAPARLRAYARAHARLFGAFQVTAGAMVALSRRPALRRRVLAGLARAPAAFDAVLRVVG